MKTQADKIYETLDLFEGIPSNNAELHDVIDILVHRMGRRFRSRDPGRGTCENQIRPYDRVAQICESELAHERSEALGPRVKTLSGCAVPMICTKAVNAL